MHYWDLPWVRPTEGHGVTELRDIRCMHLTHTPHRGHRIYQVTPAPMTVLVGEFEFNGTRTLSWHARWVFVATSSLAGCLACVVKPG